MIIRDSQKRDNDEEDDPDMSKFRKQMKEVLANAKPQQKREEESKYQYSQDGIFKNTFESNVKQGNDALNLNNAQTQQEKPFNIKVTSVNVIQGSKIGLGQISSQASPEKQLASSKQTRPKYDIVGRGDKKPADRYLAANDYDFHMPISMTPTNKSPSKPQYGEKIPQKPAEKELARRDSEASTSSVMTIDFREKQPVKTNVYKKNYK